MSKILLVIFCTVAAAAYPSGMPKAVSVGIVSQDIDGILMKQYQIGGICSLDLNSHVTLSVPVMYTYHQQSSSWMVEASVHAAFYPGGGGIWAGTTLMQHIITFSPQEDHYWIHEVSAGYTVTLAPRWKLTAYLVFRDPYRRYQDELAELQEFFPSYGTVEPGIILRWYPGRS